MDDRSAPAENACSPAPVRTTTRTPSSALARASASRISAKVPIVRALRRAGLSMVRVATRSATS